MFFLFLLIFFHNFANGLNSTTEDFAKNIDNTLIVSLQKYNVFTPGGESIDLRYKLPPCSERKIVVTKIPADVHFVVLQVHSYLVSVNLSLDYVPLQNNSIAGTNVGLVKIYSGSDLSFYLTYCCAFEEVDIMVSVQAYSAEAPIPGGCNMEFPIEISPFLLTNYDDVTTDVNFAPSSPPLSVFSQFFLPPNSECNLKPPPVHHKMYHRYFPERDFSKETYFSILKSMMTKGRILENANLVPEKLTSPPLRRIFATYPGTGNAFVVISQFGNYTSVYVPSFTYGCDNLEDNNTCPVLTTTFAKVLCAIVLFLGVFTCFFGHFFFRIEIFLLGFFASGIISYILISHLFSPSIALTTSVTIGFIFALLKLLAWNVFGTPIGSIILTTLLFGFLLASIIYYPIIDYVNLFVLDINFWGIFIGIVVACPILMMCLAEKANIISCAFVGSYVGISSIDHYIGSNLRFIFINTIRRAVSDKFKLAIIDPPFQIKDAMLCVAWIFMMLMGVAIQKSLMKFKPPYPPPTNPMEKIMKRFKRPSSSRYSPSEISPLLPNYANNMSGLF